MIVDKHILSETITWIRFPLIWLVVLLHTIISPQTYNGDVFLKPGDLPVFDWFQYFSQRQVGDIAVPTFMLISGYLLFRGKAMSIDVYKEKLKSRFHTLLIPYITWNLLFLFYIFVCNWIVPSLMSSMGDYVRNFTFISLLNAFFFPVLAPMWFIRDLIFLNLLAYPIYYILKKVGFFFIICLVCLFLFKVYYSIPLVGIRSIFPFCLGAYLSISKHSFLYSLTKRWLWIFLMYIVLLVIDTERFIHGKDMLIVHQLLLIIGVCFFLTSVYALIRRGWFSPNKQLANTSFFVFAFHMFFINILNKFWSIILPVNTFTSILVQVLIPTIACGICVSMFCLFRWLMPPLCSILVGGRTK
ncbi:acyltransferase family protein [Prevotella melaninogenica]|jgi:putative membrane protein|uniref:acyltransferase family protein n=1 Tax=Prevotella melaninogenica TaxID=28132 RepID=UPI001C5EACD7|nr:acyltransferase [Prevotella melaninogenica]MBW4729324.1 acyltransferase [Prevotella melaninogenica]MBW4731972.1 acyltransferase [Prevotella melaninogenica]MBW4749833.1 acyltransferase [Prevotella melaninogenica]